MTALSFAKTEKWRTRILGSTFLHRKGRGSQKLGISPVRGRDRLVANVVDSRGSPNCGRGRIQAGYPNLGHLGRHIERGLVGDSDAQWAIFHV